ncbi:MAG: hypothetical protein U0002_22505 [Thermoanaerobaculia bacterium]
MALPGLGVQVVGGHHAERISAVVTAGSGWIIEHASCRSVAAGPVKVVASTGPHQVPEAMSKLQR